MSDPATSAPLAQRAARGAAWVLGLRLAQRGFGLLRLLVLAYLLGPEDFGATGMALLLVSVLNALSQTSFQTALIQRRGPVEAYLDAAWTALVLRGVAIFALLVVLAPFAADFFSEPQVVPLIRVLAFSVLLQSFSNVGVVLLERELDFRRFAAYQIAGTLADLAVSVAAAVLLRNAWALVIGLLAGDAVRLVASYWVHGYRPRLRLDLGRTRELFDFGKWLLLSNLFLFLAHQGDDVLVGRLLGVTALGLYQLAYQLSHAVTMELSRIASQVALPSYARLQADLGSLRRAFLRVLEGTALISWPVAGLVCLLAGDFIRLFLAERWLPIVPVVEILALHGAVRAMGAAHGPLFVAIGRPQLLTWLTLLKLVAIASVIVPLIHLLGIRGAALAVLAASLVSNAASSATLIRTLRCRPREVLLPLAAPLLATLGMGAFLVALRGVLSIQGPVPLAVHALLGIAVYALGVALLGHVGGHPLSPWLRGVAAGWLPARPSAGGDR